MNRQMELMHPADIEAEIAARSIVYAPLGTIEFHGAHLPVGLDGLTSHGICLLASMETGGIVLPPLYYGTGGGHTVYPWTIMIDSRTFHEVLSQSVSRLQEFGVRHIVLFTGHFAEEQLDIIERLAEIKPGMIIQSLSVSMADGLEYKPDHAGIFETTLLSALRPDLARLDLLPPIHVPDTAEDAMGAQRHDPSNPLYGIFGPDPREYHESAAMPLLSAMVDWLVGRVNTAHGAICED